MKSFIFSILLTISMYQLVGASDLDDTDLVTENHDLKRKREYTEDSLPPAKREKKEVSDSPDQIMQDLINSNDMQIDSSVDLSRSPELSDENEFKDSKSQSNPKQETKFRVLPVLQTDSFDEDELDIDNFLKMPGTKIALFDFDKTLLRDKLLFHNFDPEDQDIILDGYWQSDHFAGTCEEFKLFKIFMKKQDGDIERIKQNVLINEKTLHFIQKLEQNGVIAAGLTARHFYVASLTDQNLKDKGVNFAELSGLGESTINHPIYPEEAGLYNGAYFTHNLFPKVQAIPCLVDLIATQNNLPGPFYVAHFDDSEDEIKAFLCPETLPSAIPGRSITCVPVFYEGHYHYMLKVFAEQRDLLYQEIDEALRTYNLQKKKNTYRDQYLKFCQQHEFVF